jgi:energy-coupling factor transporter transmembrane protein EcfT
MKNNDNGIGFTGLLQIVLITLKLLDKITWRWVWVLSPAWIYAIIFILLVFFSVYKNLKGE